MAVLYAKKAEHSPVAEIAGIEPADVCKAHMAGPNPISPATDRCTTLFCRVLITYSLSLAREADRPMCMLIGRLADRRHRRNLCHYMWHKQS